MAESSIIEKSSAKLLEFMKQENLPVDKLILFGSYAKGEAKEESDIDYIVVSASFRNMSFIDIVNRTMYIDSKMIKEFLKPFDILYYSDIDWESSRAIPVNEAKKYGKILYTANL